MNTKFRRETKDYLKKISSMLPEHYPNKKRILKEIEKNLYLCIESHPLSSWKDILEEFGSADEVIEFAMSEYSGTDITAHFYKKQKFYILLLFIGTVFVLFTFILLGYRYYLDHYKNYFINDSHYFLDGTEVSPEEYYEKNYIP